MAATTWAMTVKARTRTTTSSRSRSSAPLVAAPRRAISVETRPTAMAAVTRSWKSGRARPAEMASSGK